MTVLRTSRLVRMGSLVVLLLIAMSMWVRPALAQAPITYIVQRGDTVESIARVHNTTVEAIAAANNLNNPNFIYVGQRLVIPSAGVTVTGAAATAQVTPPITVDQPTAGQSVASPISVRGKARVPNGQVQVRLVGREGQVLAEGSAWGGVEATVPFSLTLHYAVTEAQDGVIEAYRRDQATLQVRDRITVPVTLVPPLIVTAPPAITVSQPISGQQATSPLSVRGEANTANGLVWVRLWDGANRVVARGIAWVGRGRGPQPFVVDLHFVTPITQRGMLEVYQSDLTAMGKRDFVVIPLDLEEQARPAEPPTREGLGEKGEPVVTCPLTHVVQQGENLFRIALRYGVTVEQVARVNNITNVNIISIGRQLTIPCPGK